MLSRSVPKTHLRRTALLTIPRIPKASLSAYHSPVRMASHGGATLKQNIPEQEQNLPGLQKDMKPEPFDTHLETASGPKPYIGVGKLKGKKALITGGE